MIRALWRAMVAVQRLRRHQRRYGDLLKPEVPRETTPAYRAPWARCGQPLQAAGYYCTEPRGHHGSHRHRLTGDLELHSATAEPHPDDPEGAPLLTPPEQRATWRA